MGKATILVLLGAFAQIALMLFGSVNTDVGVFSSNSTNSASVTDIILNPASWYQNPLWLFLVGSFGAFAVASALIAGAFFFNNERVLFLGIAAIFLSFVIPIINLWQFMAAQGIWGGASLLVASFFISPMVVIAIGTIIDFAQGKD